MKFLKNAMSSKYFEYVIRIQIDKMLTHWTKSTLIFVSFSNGRTTSERLARKLAEKNEINRK